MQCDLFGTQYEIPKMDTTKSILSIFKNSGFEYVQGYRRVLHHLRKNNVDHGLIILHKSRRGFLWKFNRYEHFVNVSHTAMFSKEKHNTVFVIVVEHDTGQTIIGCLANLVGIKTENYGVPVFSFPREQFIPLDEIVNNQSKSLEFDLMKLHEWEGRCEDYC